MGSTLPKMSTSTSSTTAHNFESVETFKFHEAFEDETDNGLYFNGIYVPEEILEIILGHIDPKHILGATLVCKKWCNLIKSESFWATQYSKKYKKKPKKLPWYVYYCLFSTDYFDQNLIKNGNGEKTYKNWVIIRNGGDGFKVENPPVGADPLPLEVSEFNGKTSCFATSFEECTKLQNISFEKSRLMQLIFNRYKPHIYLSEWIAGRFDCGCAYELRCMLYGDRKETRTLDNQPLRNLRSRPIFGQHEYIDNSAEGLLLSQHERKKIEQWEGSKWSKVELLVEDYPEGVVRIVFQHHGVDTQFWKGHYGTKMAGGVLKILFDSIVPAPRKLEATF